MKWFIGHLGKLWLCCDRRREVVNMWRCKPSLFSSVWLPIHFEPNGWFSKFNFQISIFNLHILMFDPCCLLPWLFGAKSAPQFELWWLFQAKKTGMVLQVGLFSGSHCLKSLGLTAAALPFSDFRPIGSYKRHWHWSFGFYCHGGAEVWSLSQALGDGRPRQMLCAVLLLLLQKVPRLSIQGRPPVCIKGLHVWLHASPCDCDCGI